MASEPDFKCYYCTRTFPLFNEVIDYSIFHPDAELKFKRRVEKSDRKIVTWQSKSFKNDEVVIIQSVVKESGRFIYSYILTEIH